MNDELDHIMGALRGPATGDELADESAVVDRMCHAHESKGPTMFTSRRTRVATLVAAGVLGFGSVAAAGPVAMQIVTGDTQNQQEEQSSAPEDGEEIVEQPVEGEEDGGDVVEEVAESGEGDSAEVEEATEEVEEAVDAEVVEEAADGEVVEDDATSMPTMEDDPDTFFNEEDCLPGNHGKTVSAVARGELKLKVDGVDIEVRDAARSSCGKDVEVDLDEDVDPEENVELDEKFEVEEMDEPEPKGKPDHAGGKDKDSGKGKDKGKPEHAGKDKGKGKGGRG